jgi:hypothetical protein
MNEIVDSHQAADPAHRRERGIKAYARIFDLPEKDVPAAMAGRVGQDGLDYEALTAVMTLVTNYIGQARGSQAMEAVQRVAGPGSQTSPGHADVGHSCR